MRDEIARGQQAGGRRPIRPADCWARRDRRRKLIHRILDAAEGLDATSIRAGLDKAAETLGLATGVDGVLLPVMRQIGVWWEVGHCDVVKERMATESVRAWLDERSASAPPPTRTRPIVLACGPSDLHTIGLEAMAVMLRYQGWPCRVLGARTRRPLS